MTMLKAGSVSFECFEQEQDYHRMLDFFIKADAFFIPALSSRVDLKEYSKKLSLNAINIFLNYESEDIAECSVYCNRDIAFISSICVIDSFTKQGWGTLLLEEAEKVAMAHSCKAIELEAFYESGAVLWYKSHGYVEVNKSLDIARLRKELT